ncbi:MAG: hypothetical protein DIZ80_11980 [endosymbiont of Galathealinum brachiosum]|uniref:Pyridine nucleotide-disulfide oxidoreductase n=1 Tax=endosymbiont of Galathealinum brachiosum TaxID=2200906 RepID=A0A370DDI9_9GAMM|nr:MAG: hypothetical protein DIZ80_11980 [endosymbiont of Galathealinum brachiosum]
MTKSKGKNATILLVSGELDKAITAFEVALALASMGEQVNMWFIFYGVNSIKKPQSLMRRFRKLFQKAQPAPGRVIETDLLLQRFIPFLNSSSNSMLPLSQLNFLGLGSRFVKYIMRRKGAPSLEYLVKEADSMGVTFKICQPCVDILMIDTEKDLMVKAEVSGVSSYAVDVSKSHYNVTY